MYLFLGVSASVSSHTVLAAVLLLVVQAILNCYRTGSCCLAMVSMQVAAWLKHRVSGQGWDCCCQAGRSSRTDTLPAAIWMHSFDQPVKHTWTKLQGHIFSFKLIFFHLLKWIYRYPNKHRNRQRRLSYYFQCVMSQNWVPLKNRGQILHCATGYHVEVHLLRYMAAARVTSVLLIVLTGKHDQEGKKREIRSQRTQVLQPLNHSNLQ